MQAYWFLTHQVNKSKERATLPENVILYSENWGLNEYSVYLIPSQIWVVDTRLNPNKYLQLMFGAEMWTIITIHHLKMQF